MGMFSTATFRTIGSAATTQNLFSIWNGGTNRVVRIRRLVMQMDATAVLTSVMPLVKACRIAVAPTGGITLAKPAWDTTDTSHVDIVVRNECSADGGARTALTATPNTDTLWQQYGFRLHTAVGQVLGLDNNVLSAITDTYPVVLRQNQGILVHLIASAAGSNPATNSYFVQCAWEEDLS